VALPSHSGRSPFYASGSGFSKMYSRYRNGRDGDVSPPWLD
jgi:hypothetical protein